MSTRLLNSEGTNILTPGFIISNPLLKLPVVIVFTISLKDINGLLDLLVYFSTTVLFTTTWSVITLSKIVKVLSSFSIKDLLS
jgi:hypothetical protein